MIVFNNYVSVEELVNLMIFFSLTKTKEKIKKKKEKEKESKGLVPVLPPYVIEKEKIPEM
jgi:hypothetical protein